MSRRDPAGRDAVAPHRPGPLLPGAPLRCARWLALGLVLAAAPASAQRLPDLRDAERVQASAAQGVARQVLDLLDATRFEEAFALGSRLGDSEGDRLARAALAYVDGDYPRAADLMPSGSTETRFAGDLAERVRQAERATEGFEERSVDGFRFRYRPGIDAMLVDYAIRPLDGQRKLLGRMLGVRPERSILVEFLPDVTSFCAATGLPLDWVATTGTVAVAKWDRMMVLSPINSPRGYGWLDTLAHEYTHLALARASWDQAPIWLQEGTARVLETYWRGDFDGWKTPVNESLLARGLQDDALLPFAKMHPSMAALPSEDLAALAFAQVAFAVDWILEQVGEEGYRRLIEDLRGSGDALAAVDRVLGAAGGGFETRYVQQLERSGFRLRADVARFETELTADADYVDGKLFLPQKPEGEEASDPVLQASKVSRDHARLGDLLRKRGRPDAALLEYARAEAAAPHHSPALANKKARALLSVQKADDARRELQATVELYPEYTPTVTLLADVLHRAGRYREAKTTAERAVGLNPFDPLPHAILLDLARRRKDEAEAAREEAALTLLADELGLLPPPSFAAAPETP